MSKPFSRMNVLRRILPHSGTTAQSGGPAGSSKKDPEPLKKSWSLVDFKLLRTVGTGSFGRVLLAKRVDDSQAGPYAVKRLKKALVIRQRQVDHIISEKKILTMISHPFIVELTATFKDDYYLYIVMEYVVGGEFFTYLRRCRRFDNLTARFYAAQVVLMFEYLHSKSIVYRDLKPENMLIARDGYLKLTDFGFAKIIDNRTYTVCGTPEYIAPEVLLSKGHGKPVDWWTTGILIYEMLVGHPPFIDDEPMGIYQKILSGLISFPQHLDRNTKSLVKKLLTHDLGKRYGNLQNGVKDIKDHRWFEGVVWEDVLNKKIIAPYKPKVSAPDDTSHFEEYPESSDSPRPITDTDDPFLEW